MHKSRRRVCRIVWRKGEPLGLAIYSTVCFLDLPPEIRDRIYNDALIAPRPITVSSVAVQKYQAQRNESNQTVISHGYIVEGKDPILYEIATNLLFCHPTIAAEAAICFYQSNTFCFEGDEVWNPLYFFLQSIGDYNRSFLRKMSVEVKMPTHLCQDRYGARITSKFGLPFHIVHSFARDPPPQVQYPRRQTFHEYDRLFQVLDPAIQACFRLLSFDGPPMLLNLDLKGRGIPGARVFLDSTETNSALPDLPDFVESLRQEFARHITVLWNGYGQKIFFDEARDQILQKGWEILETREEEIPCPSWLVRRPELPLHLMTHFTLRKTMMKTVQSPPVFCESCYIQHP